MESLFHLGTNDVFQLLKRNKEVFCFEFAGNYEDVLSKVKELKANKPNDVFFTVEANGKTVGIQEINEISMLLSAVTECQDIQIGVENNEALEGKSIVVKLVLLR